MRNLVIGLIAITGFTLACGSQGCGSQSKNGGTAETGSAPPAKTEQSTPSAQSPPSTAERVPQLSPQAGDDQPAGEIMPGFILPSGGMMAADSGAPPLPTGRDDLLAEARKARKAGNTDEALSFVDALLVMHPDDAELLEFRGTTQMRQGMLEDAKVDLDRCCSLGRQSCCKWKAPH